MSRRSPTHWDGTPARGPHRTRIDCAGTDQLPHPERLLGKIGWKRDDIHRDDPRWTPAGGVIEQGFGQIGAYGVLFSCPDCPAGPEARLFLTPEQFDAVACRLRDSGAARASLADLAAIVA